MSHHSPNPGDILIESQNGQFAVKRLDASGRTEGLGQFGDEHIARGSACARASERQSRVWQMSGGQWRQVHYLPANFLRGSSDPVPSS